MAKLRRCIAIGSGEFRLGRALKSFYNADIRSFCHTYTNFTKKVAKTTAIGFIGSGKVIL